MRMLAHVIITLLSCVTQVTSQFQCQGTCYSGSFPKNEDVIKGKHLVGYSYNNITTDVPQTCFSSCINDCRCKAFQMKDVRCELLDEDKETKPHNFKNDQGYIYYDLQQTFHKESSHMVQPSGVCYNGCCRTKPCMNGGTCVEHCENPKEKFTCKCSANYYGKVCEKKIYYSCMDVFKTSVPGTTPANGTYTITRSDTNVSKPIYCAFESPNQAWSLIESYSLSNKLHYFNKGFNQDVPRNLFSPNWNDYRTNLGFTKYLRSRATMFRATCDYEKRSSLTPDFLLGYLKEFDLASPTPIFNSCIKLTHIDILGHYCFNCTVSMYQQSDVFHLHVDVNYIPTCQFRPPVTSNNDYFGFYVITDPQSKCTATQQSTTQWWLGEQQ